MNSKDLGWIAGFIEGEGTFNWARVTPCVSVSQVQRWPLDKLQRLCGGNVYYIVRKTKNPKWNDYNKWYIYGDEATKLIKSIYPFLSPKRQEQAKAIYTKRYQQVNAPKLIKTICKHGHLWIKKNIYTFKKDGRQICKVCARGWREKWLQKVVINQEVLNGNI